MVPYLERLGDAAQITLISFEKPNGDRRTVMSRLEAAGIRWIPLSYHRSPPLASTWWDVVAGTRTIDRTAARRPPDIIHSRSYVPALMVLRSAAARRSKFLFDIRGFWADERVDGGIWRRGLLYKVAKTYERGFFSAADAVVTLTDASTPYVEAWTSGRIQIAVIPTCVDVRRFEHSAPRSDGPHAVWNGSIGTWQRFDLGVRLARALRLPFTVLTRQTALARSMLGQQPAEVRSVAPHQIPRELRYGDIGLCLYQRTFSNIARAPTRFAEHLAAGNPVAVTSELGDVDDIVERHKIGVVLREESDAAVSQAAISLRKLAADPETRRRCRAVAQGAFDIEMGAQRYGRLYASLVRGSSPDRSEQA